MEDGLSRGVIMFNCGKKCIPRMIVCLRSLRKHYDGNLTVFLEGPHEQALIDGIRDQFKANVVYREVSPSKYRALLRKIEICQDSPYDLSIVLDTDTIVVGDFSELFEAAKGHDLAIPHFAGWSSGGKTIGGRVKGYAPLKPDYIEAALKYGPAINCGVFAWPRGTPIFKEWLPIADWGDNTAHIYIADEVACQLLLPRYNVNVIGTRCNVSVIHDPGTPDPRIIHYHGKKHVLEEPKCKFWIQEFVEALRDDTLGIKKMVLEDNDDRRLRRFIGGKTSEMHGDLQKETRQLLGITGRETCPGIKDEDVTIVTACDPKYIEHLKVTLPNWIKHKHVDKFEMIVYVNGFRRYRRNSDLDFLREHKNIRIIPWDMPEAADQRERMLSAFVLGAAKDVKTPYWVKIDADAYASDDSPLLKPEMKDNVIAGHRWGYSFAKHIKPLMAWANEQPAFKDTPKDIFDETKVEGRKYWHPRVASFVQFHKSDFVRMAAEIAGAKLPVPSHDTYLWYVANRLGLPIMRTNFKTRRGMGNKTDLETLKGIVARIDGENVPQTIQDNQEDDDDVDESHD